MQGMRKTKNIRVLDCPGEDRVEPEGTPGVQSMEALEQKEENGADELLERLLDRDNLNEAYRKVKRNGGAAGIDGMTVEELLPYLKEHKEEMLRKLRTGKYKPKPVRRVDIPKPGGGTRQLGIPTVLDRMIQQALVQVLTPIFEPTFSEGSFGFRPGRSAHQAIQKTKEYYEEGYRYVVDIDMEKYFDTVNHDILMTQVQKKVESRTVRKLIRAFLTSGVMTDGMWKASVEGTPQGGPLSPLLSNIYLSQFDRMLEERGHRFVRYADDCNVYVKSMRAAERVMEGCVEYLEGKLRLRVNREKSRTGSPLKRKFLGFSLYATAKGKAKIRPHQKPKQMFRKKIRQITKRNRGRSMERILQELNRFTQGWIRYYGIGEMKQFMADMNQWIRRRLRMYIWKQWKKVSARLRNLQLLGIDRRKAWEWANTRKGYWRIANSFILTRTLTDKYLASLGYKDVAKQYEALHLTF